MNSVLSLQMLPAAGLGMACSDSAVSCHSVASCRSNTSCASQNSQPEIAIDRG